MPYVSPVYVAPVAPPRIAGMEGPPAPATAAEGEFSTDGALEVASRRTPMSQGAIRSALAGAYRSLHGQPMPKGMLDILSAHVAHETARGERMFNFNFGGIKGTGPSGLTARYRTTEVLDGESKKVVDGFRAYRSAAEGAMDYLKLLEGRYSGAVDEAARGDVAGFAAALKRSGYYTADVGDYTRAMQAHVHEQQAPRSTAASHPVAAIRAPSALPREAGIGASLGGGQFLYGKELAAEALRFDGFGARQLPTSLEVARVVDAVSALGARVGAPPLSPRFEGKERG